MVRNSVPEGTRGGSSKAVLKKLIPDGATAGATVVGAHVGEVVGVPAQTRAQRWTTRQKAEVSTRRVPLRWSQFAENSRAVPCAPLAMCHTTPEDAQCHTHVRTFWEYPLRTPECIP